MSIITKGGDKGETSLLGGARVPKTDKRIEAYGTVDELNATIGMAMCHAKKSKLLSQVQNDLFKIGAELSALDTQFTNFPKITQEDADRMEKEVHIIEQALPKQNEFILPRGTQAAAALHLARTVCRRAEREVVACGQQHKPRPELVIYLNRLSDLLFIYARQENSKDEPVKYD